MIVGNGQIARAFKEDNVSEDCIIFASGVANSNCCDPEKFKRERDLLSKYLNKLGNKKIVYFSSCALSAEGYILTDYYEHKLAMEELIKGSTSNYYIFRIPQLFGEIKRHPTLINYLYYSILDNKRFTLFDKAYRYVIELYDLRNLVMEIILSSNPGICIDLANPYIYSVLDIVKYFEKVLGKKANYQLIDRKDGYSLPFTELKKYMSSESSKLKFGENYLYEKLDLQILNTKKSTV